MVLSLMTLKLPRTWTPESMSLCELPDEGGAVGVQDHHGALAAAVDGDLAGAVDGQGLVQNHWAGVGPRLRGQDSPGLGRIHQGLEARKALGQGGPSKAVGGRDEKNTCR